MGNKKILIAAMVATFCIGGMMATSASAASRYGPGGLGSNLHRRFVIKQAAKRAKAGKPVRNRAITWYARPYLRARSR